MIINLGFEFPISARRSIIECLVALDGELKLTHERDGEDEAQRIIRDRSAFVDYAATRDLVPLLKGPNLECMVSREKERITCTCWLDSAFADQVQRVMARMAIARPIFGYACAKNEYDYRNRLRTQIDVDLIESRVGRDTDKYVPGLYWMTLLSGELARKHNVSVDQLQRVARERLDLGVDMHLFRFFESPDEWQTQTTASEFAKSQPGIFNIELVREVVQREAKTIMEVIEITRKWR